jgi:tetratricopeptide (TPR) repeat protein
MFRGKMSLRNRVRLVMIALIGLWFLAHALLLGPRHLLGGSELWSLLLTVATGIVISNLVVRRPFTRFREALAREDIAAAREELSTLSDFWRRRGREVMKANGISILIVDGHYQDALAHLQALDIKRMPKKALPVITSQMAWCMAQMGEPAKAITLAQTVFPQMESMGPDYSSSANLVQGVCEFLLGRPLDAIPHLEKAYSKASGASRKATAAFYLGESYSALGKATESRLAYQQSHQALPNGRFGIRALEHLK